MAYTDKLQSFYGRLALFISFHPWKFCIIGFLVNGLLGLGMLNLPNKHLLNNNIEEVYMPRNTATEKTAQKILQIFPDHSRDDFYYHQTVHKPLIAELIIWGLSKPSLINESFYERLSFLMAEIKNLSFMSTNGEMSTYYDVCARRNNKCVVNGEIFIDCMKENKNGTIPLKSLIPENSTILENPLLLLADYHVTNETLVNATYLRIRFNLSQNTTLQAEDSDRWIGRFVSHMKESVEKWRSKNVCIAFSTSRSFLEEIGNDTYNDIPFFSFVFTIYFVYIGFVMSGGNILAKRVHIGRMGIIVTPTSILGAWGLLMACEVEFTNVIGITPVLIVSHQIINTMVTLSHLADAYHISDGKERVAYAVRMSSLPVTVTMICNVVPFSIATMSKYYALELVSIYNVVTILFNYVNHFIFYTACLAIHEQRIDAGRHCCICTKLKPKEELEGQNCCIICCCSGSRPNMKTDTESSLEKIARKSMLRVLLTTPVKIIALISFLALLASTILGLLNYKIDVFQKSEVLPDSYYYHWNEVASSHFNNQPIIQFVTFHPYGYFNDSSSVLELRRKLVEEGESMVSWSDVISNNSYSNKSSGTDFYELIRCYFDTNDLAFVNDIYFDESRSVITASRFYLQSKQITSSKALISLKHKLLSVADEFNDILKGKYHGVDEYLVPVSLDDNFILVFSPEFYQIDDMYRPLWEILIFTGTQLGLLLFLFFLLKPSLTLLVLLLLSYVSMTLSILGASNFMGIYLTQISLIVYIVAACFCVEIIVHIFYAFSQTPGDNKAACLNSLVSNNIQAMFHTIFGLFLGILVLFLVRSYVFVTVFKISLITTVIVILFTLLWIPSILAISGPVDSGMRLESINIYKPGSAPDNASDKCAEGFVNQSFKLDSKHE